MQNTGSIMNGQVSIYFHAILYNDHKINWSFRNSKQQSSLYDMLFEQTISAIIVAQTAWIWI